MNGAKLGTTGTARLVQKTFGMTLTVDGLNGGLFG